MKDVDDMFSMIDDLDAKRILDKLAKDIGYDNVALVYRPHTEKWEACLTRYFKHTTIFCGALFYDSFKPVAREYAYTDVSGSAYKDLLRRMLAKSADGYDVSIDIVNKYLRKVFLKKGTTLEEILIKYDMEI